ncbi:UbiX family flavin prenyltransferase [Anaerocolumna xylanovorans]|uniref:Flavin prenyltransferase UbiX n=1 Tax=Anaerocolumna xylanovorans DSM 12503 TaxID=1121345 RepID=A0A1M7YJQ5_9FIRM|nr:UbiX family flavin prenyltransferase [Anaerocolumna xylanovorans]SHO52859.1 4-hydroxy-3-polyprenylbenzoate decarboxylase [Anaerocolumna xylanovorans DSM 12503]
MEQNPLSNDKKRLVVGMSGASGAVLTIKLLQLMKTCPGWETHLVISKGAQLTIAQETSYTLSQVEAMADVIYDINDYGGRIASGTYQTEGMVIIPCSMKTVAGIACGYSDNLLLRAADVTLKERRKLVLIPRESPLSTIHLRNMLTLAETGAYIMPPVVPYYSNVASLDDMNLQIIGKVLDKFHIPVNKFHRWGDV